MPRIRKNIEAFSRLKRRNQIIYQRVSPSTAHMNWRYQRIINLKLELVFDKPKSQDQLAADKKIQPWI